MRLPEALQSNDSSCDLKWVIDIVLRNKLIKASNRMSNNNE